MGPFARIVGTLRVLVLLVGMILLPLRATAATFPLLVAYDATVAAAGVMLNVALVGSSTVPQR